MKTTMKLFCLVMACAMLLSFTTAVAEQKPIVIKVACQQVRQDVMAIELEAFMQEVTERTNGGIVFEFYPGGELGTNFDIMDMMQMGGNIIMQQGMDGFSEIVPDVSVFGAPYIFESLDEVPILMASDWYAEKMEELAAGGIQALSMNWIAGTRNMISNTRIEKASDLKGLNVRGAATTIFSELMKSVQATHLTSLWSEVYTGLSNGTFDVAEANIGLLYSSNLYEVCKYLSLTAHNTMCTGLVMGKKFYDTLPDEYKEILKECSEKYGASYSAKAVEADNEAIAAFKEKGVEVIEVDLPSFVEAAQAVYQNVPGWTPGIYETIRGIIEAGKQ